MRRDIFTPEHDAFRLMVREFIAREVVPCYADWEKAAEIEAGQALLDRAIGALVRGELDNGAAATTKLFCTEMQARGVDRCLQLFGGYGYITEFPIARLPVRG
jgi:Acyl-CoA dehydrogenase, C-terminal domain/Acyl-CoA dehydrogenase, N-terminal domain